MSRRRTYEYVAAFALTFGLLASLFAHPQIVEPAEAEDLNNELKQLKKDLAHIDTRKTQVLIVGNSMVGEGIDEDLVSATSGKRVTMIHRGGSTSAWWYLALTELTGRLQAKPETVVVMFRDRVFSKPDWRVDKSQYRAYLQALNGFANDLVVNLSFNSNNNRLDIFLRRFLPFYSQSEGARSWLYGMSRSVASRILGLEAEQVQTAVDTALSEKKFSKRLFTRAQLDYEAGLGDEMSAGASGFEPSATFLSAMIEHARLNDINLVLVRIKRRRDAAGEPLPKALTLYNRQLEQYIAENGVRFLDASKDESLRLEHYAVGDHLNRKEGRRLFSSMVGRYLASLDRHNGALSQTGSGAATGASNLHRIP